LPGVHGHALYNLDIGVKVEKMTNATHRQGPIIISGKDPRAFEEKIQRIKETLKIEVETGNGIGSPIWR
jgi:hypothetical protein